MFNHTLKDVHLEWFRYLIGGASCRVSDLQLRNFDVRYTRGIRSQTCIMKLQCPRTQHHWSAQSPATTISHSEPSLFDICLSIHSVGHPHLQNNPFLTCPLTHDIRRSTSFSEKDKCTTPFFNFTWTRRRYEGIQNECWSLEMNANSIW